MKPVQVEMPLTVALERIYPDHMVEKRICTVKIFLWEVDMVTQAKLL